MQTQNRQNTSIDGGDGHRITPQGGAIEISWLVGEGETDSLNWQVHYTSREATFPKVFEQHEFDWIFLFGEREREKGRRNKVRKLDGQEGQGGGVDLREVGERVEYFQN